MNSYKFMIGLGIWVVLLALLGCKFEEKEKLYTIIFSSPKSGEIVTNENISIDIDIKGSFSPEEKVKVLLNSNVIYLSQLKGKLSINTTLSDITNFLECIVVKDDREIQRSRIYFIYQKPYSVKLKKLKFKPVKVKGIKKYEEVKPQVVLPKIEEVKESEYISSVSLDILNENEVGYFKDIIQISYKVEFYNEFKSKALEYLRGVYIEMTTPDNKKVFSESLKEPGISMELDVSKIPTGTYILTVKAEDKVGKVYESSRWVKIDKTPPKIYLEDLTNNTIVRGMFYFSSMFEDDAGILSVSASVGDVDIMYEKQNGKVVFYFDSTKIKNGIAKISIKVVDKMTNTSETNIQVLVDNWFEEVVDSTSGAGFHISAFVDVNKNIYLAYHNISLKNLFFAQRLYDSDKWQIQVVDKEVDTGKYPSIFVDKFSRIHISYSYINEKWDDEDLRYAIKEGKDWKVITLDQQDKAGRYTSMVVDDKGIPHISYYNYTVGSLRYITYNIKMDRWEVSVPDSYENVGSDTSIAIYNNTIHIFYLDNANGDLKHCWKGIEETDVGWKFEVVDSEGKTGYYEKMKIDSKGNIHVVYYDSTSKSLKYAVKYGNKWNIVVVDKKDDPGRFISLFVDKNDNPHISYFVESKKEIRYAFFDGKKWDIQVVVSGRAGGYSSIVVVDDKPIIFFYDAKDNVLKLAKK